MSTLERQLTLLAKLFSCSWPKYILKANKNLIFYCVVYSNFNFYAFFNPKEIRCVADQIFEQK